MGGVRNAMHVVRASQHSIEEATDGVPTLQQPPHGAGLTKPRLEAGEDPPFPAELYIYI
jgi:hypothetical protein